MPKPRSRGVPPAAINVRAATQRVQSEMEAREVGNKQIGAIIGVSEGQVSHKVRMTGRSKFDVDELGLIGQHWEKEYDAPFGWPFLDWAYAGALRDAASERDRMQKELKELRHELDRRR